MRPSKLEYDVSFCTQFHQGLPIVSQKGSQNLALLDLYRTSYFVFVVGLGQKRLSYLIYVQQLPT